MDPAALIALARHGEEIATIRAFQHASHATRVVLLIHTPEGENAMLESTHEGLEITEGDTLAFIPATAAVPAAPRALPEIRPTPASAIHLDADHGRARRAAGHDRPPRRGHARAREGLRRPDRRDRGVPDARPGPADHVRRPRGRAGRAAGRRRPVRAVNLRPERPADFAAIRALHRAAFAPSELEADIADDLRRANDHVPDLCLVAHARRHDPRPRDAQPRPRRRAPGARARADRRRSRPSAAAASAAR